MPSPRTTRRARTPRPSRPHRRPLSLLGLSTLLVLSLVATAPPATSEVLSGAEPATLGQEPQITPAELGEDTLEGLQLADPTENLDLVAPPEADNQGGAALSHPLGVPAGRAGVEPTLELAYDSGGGNGWLGTGWDLGLGAVEVDTRWGTPLFCPAAGAMCGQEGERDVESETYLLDGDQLSPTAVRFPFADREGDKADWTRRVETEWERIVRHGDSPSTYWWEVTDKTGTTRYYGGTPEGTRDPRAILTDDAGNAVRWGLSGVRDISSNIMRITYDKPAGTGVGAEDATLGTGFYPRSIRYTGSLAAGVPDDPAYEIVFLRDGDLGVTERRPDVVVDASTGALEVTSDLLRRVEVRHGTPAADGTARTTYGTLVKAWNLTYTEEAFGKSLLRTVEQVGSDDAVAGSHTFTYYDEVGYDTGTYDGFAGDAAWTTGGGGGANDLNQTLLGGVELSALGASETNSGDGHAYIGFNATAPSKTGSFGGSISVSGGGTGGLVEMMDLNGDLLPDKVFRSNITGAGVQYRLNTSGPGGTTTFGAAKPVVGIGTLSTEASVGISGGPEAYFGVSVQFNIAADVSIGEQYFTDVNNDGRPDYVSAGKVWFNTPDGSGGVEFRDDSSGTAVPIDPGTASLAGIEALQEFEDFQRASSPLQDVVRRWVAPFTGTVQITGDATLDPPSGAGYAGDGVRAAVQYRGTELWAANLATPGASATPTGVDSVAVERGRALYFRVGSVDDGAEDLLRWEPVVTYTSLGTPGGDANGLSQTEYAAAEDFTLAGRPDTPVLMPLAGTVRVEGTLTKSAATSDDLTVLVIHNGAVVHSVPVAATATGDVAVSTDIDVAAPVPAGDPAQPGSADSVVVRIAADSPVDPTVLSFAPRLYYTQAFDGATEIPVLADLDGDLVADEPALELEVPYDIDIYPRNDLTAPAEPWASDLDEARTVTVSGQVDAVASTEPGTVVLTVKRRTADDAPGEVVAKGTFDVPLPVLPGGVSTGSTSLDVELDPDEDYWFDLTVREPGLSDHITGSDVSLSWTDDDDVQQDRDVPQTLNWAGRQAIFPIAHRGWAYAGYNADGRSTTAIDEQAFEFDRADYPEAAPTGFGDDTYQDPAQGESYTYTPYVLDVVGAGGVVTAVPIWRGIKDNLAGGAGFMSSSRTGADSIGVAGSAAGAGVQAVRRVGVSAPVFGLVAGIGPVSGAFGAGPSFGLLDYVDMNGDAFPDVVAPGRITYTTPRGGYLPGSGDGPDVVGQDTTFAVSGGFEGTAIDVKGNSKGDANTAQDTAATSGSGKKPTSSGSAQQGEAAETQESGANVGASLGITAQFTNPGSLSADWNEGLGATDLDTDAPLERELADVNGDGLPDQVVASLDGVSVYLNLGYRFSDTAVKWSGGAFENGESYSGSVGPLLGFNYNKKEFSGGLSYSEGIDQARYSWVDVDGDGVLDRIRKAGDGTMVAFGSGSGLAPEVDYGSMVTGELELIGDIPLGEQAAQDRSRGLGGGFDFMIPVGPLCPPPIGPGCYIIVNPGASYERSLSSTQVQLTDVDGDGYPDSVRSTADGSMTVRANNRGRTNLLQSVTNPLGGEIRLGYTRDGNTEDQPYPVWLMTSVEVDDNRPGDGPDVQATTYLYEGGRFDPVEREQMGYSTVTEQQRDGALDAAVLRQTVRAYATDTVFDSGLVTSEVLQDGTGQRLSSTTSTWTLTELTDDVATSAPGDAVEALVSRPATGAEALALLDDAHGVVRTKVVQAWYDGDGNLGTSRESTFAYDDLGNVTEQGDPGQAGTDADDLTSLTTYSQCRDSSWVSQPAIFTVVGSDGDVLRERDGSTDLCLNAVPIHLEERIDDAAVAVTDLEFDAWGSYDRIAYPENADGERYTVDYVYDADRHTDVAEVVDSHGLTATATYSPAGRVTARVDANAATTSYTYDAFGRLATIRSPYEQDPAGPPTVAFDYAPTAPDYGYAVARHHDRFNGDTIDTVAFVDGIGRVTQTKHDADILAGDPAEASTDEMIVAGAVEFDALGREVKEWFPIVEPLGTIGTYQTATSTYPPTVTSYTLLDQVAEVSVPNGDDGDEPHVTTMEYSFGSVTGVPAGLFVTTTSDANRNAALAAQVTDPTVPDAGKQHVTYTDVRDNLLVVDERPADAEPLQTRMRYDALGQLVSVLDSAENLTTHTYDGLGRRLSTETPDGGLRELSWDPAGNLVSEVTPNLRAEGLSIDYAYDVDRLVRIDYPAGTPDVAYTYGAPGAAGNGAGRVVALEDGARLQSLTYDALGNVAQETTTMKAHNLNPETQDKLTFTTGFTYDSFGRLDTLTYPDGEVLAHEYDSGGLLSGMEGTKACTELGALTAPVDAVATTITVTERASSVPGLPFTITIGGEQLRVTDRVATGTPGQYTYTVERGINGTVEVPTAQAHAAGATVTSDVAVTCTYRYLDRQEYDEFLDRRLRRTGNGVVSQWAMDYIGRLETLVTDTDVRQVQNLTYSYDKVDNVLSMVNEVPAAVPSLYVGPSEQTYGYDPYYRLSSAEGTADVPPGRVREFTLSLTYDAHGNVTRKEQTDVIRSVSGRGRVLVQTPTTYTFEMDHAGDGPHQLTLNGPRSYTYDANGNLTGWDDSETNETRAVTWDAEDRITRIDDGSDTTDYTYDADGRRAIERGPDGETSFVNRWYTVRNGSVPWKNIWAGDDRLGSKRSFDDDYEHQQYYLHKDLQGSTNVVTDDTGKVFEHWEYLPGGEPWIREDSNVHRTPYLYAGGYLDEVRDLVSLGQRWYEPREGIFYSPDPILHRDPAAAAADPALLPAYSYAHSSPLRLVDPGGDAPDAAGADLRSPGIAAAVGRLAAAGKAAAFQADLARSSRLWQALVRFSGTDRAKSLQAFSERFEMKPLVQVNLVKTADGWAVQDVQLSPFGFVQKKVYEGATDRAGRAGTDPAADDGLGGQSAPVPGAGTPAADAAPANGPPVPGTATAPTGAGAAPGPAPVGSRAGAGPAGGGLGSSSLSSGVGAADGPPDSGAS